MSDLSHITGSCARCKRTNLKAEDFIEAHLRQFLAEQTSARGRNTFTDARENVHAATKKTEVAGARLFCRACVEAERAALAAGDSTWNDGDDAVSTSAATSAAATVTLAQDQAVVADSWEDDEDD